MSYVTLEVDIDNGRVVPREPKKLPSTGRGLLTILESAENTSTASPMNALQALEALQAHLRIDGKKAEEWMAAVRDARR